MTKVTISVIPIAVLASYFTITLSLFPGYTRVALTQCYYPGQPIGNRLRSELIDCLCVRGGWFSLPPVSPLSLPLFMSVAFSPVALQPKAVSGGRKVNHTILQKHHTLCSSFHFPDCVSAGSRRQMSKHGHLHTIMEIHEHSSASFLACNHVEWNFRFKWWDQTGTINLVVIIIPPYWMFVHRKRENKNRSH